MIAEIALSYSVIDPVAAGRWTFEGVLMQCKHCLSNKIDKFSGEVAIHLPGIPGLNKSIVWVFRDIMVCLDCGCATFDVPSRELAVLSPGTIGDGEAVSEE